jgi:hypothetical protein
MARHADMNTYVHREAGSGKLACSLTIFLSIWEPTCDLSCLGQNTSGAERQDRGSCSHAPLSVCPSIHPFIHVCLCLPPQRPLLPPRPAAPHAAESVPPQLPHAPASQGVAAPPVAAPLPAPEANCNLLLVPVPMSHSAARSRSNTENHKPSACLSVRIRPCASPRSNQSRQRDG